MLRELKKLIEDEKKETIKEILLQNEKEEGMVETVGEPEEDHLYIVKTPLQLEREDTVGLVIDDEIINLGFVLGNYDQYTYLVYPTQKQYINGSHILVKSESLISYDLQLNILDKLEERDDPTIKEIKTLLFKNKTLPHFTVKSKTYPHLDEFQEEVVNCALSLDKGELLLVVGPPGTGKTRIISTIAREITDKVLITSHTNRAVDEAIERLPPERSVRVAFPSKSGLKEHLLELKVYDVVGDRLRELDSEINKCLAKKDYYGAKEYYAERRKVYEEVCEKIISETPIVGATLIKSWLPPLLKFKFDYVLVDEASQITIPLALLGLLKAKRYVLLGDHRQLPPVLKSVRSSENYSVFNHLKKKYPHRVKWLKKHYRSNIEIAKLLKMFYEEEIIPANICKNINLELEWLKPPIVFIHVPNAEESKDENKSKFNVPEAKVCVSLVEKLIDCGVSEKDIAVISPYRAQVELLKEYFKAKKLAVDVGTVDSFQGCERDVVVFSVTASKISRLSLTKTD